MAEDKNIDDFWDLSELVPKNKNQHTPPKKADVSAVEIEIPVKKPVSTPLPPEENKLGSNVLNTARRQEPSFVYENSTPLIKKVSVYNWYNEYSYYELFCKHAAYYQKVQAKECPREYFFSYMPQYSQMNQKQLSWYFWWRFQVNNGVYLDTDYPYILLYVFELINLSTQENARATLDTLINLWSAYHDDYPQLNKTLGEWICDTSLIYSLPITFPDKRINKEMISGVEIPEIFYSFDMSDIGLLSKFLLSYCNSYNYRKSKFYDDSTAELFETHIPAALESVLLQSNQSDKLFSNTEKQASRGAFMGALCSYRIKKRIELTYASMALESELKIYISNVVKYAENKIRSAAGARSKLGIKNLSADTKKAIDRYFSSAFGDSSDCVITPEYEKLYDLVSEPLSVDVAKEIESNSWEITQKLVEAFEEECVEENTISIPPTANEVLSQENDEPQDEISEFYLKISKYAEFFELVKQKNFSAQLDYVKSNKLIIEAVVEEINKIAADVLGDILLEELDVGYCIIEDYEDMFIK